MRERNKKIKTSLNLGGGSARGFAHIGVLKLFEEQRIGYDMIIGISMGAFVGSLYAVEPDADFVRERFFDMMSKAPFHRSLMNSYGKNLQTATGVINKMNKVYFQTSLLKRMLTQKGMAPQEEMEENLYPILPDISIENTRIPFATTAVCMETGEATVFTKGSIRKAVMASAALPMVFPPQLIGNLHYIDGGVLDKLGIETAKLIGIERKVIFDVSNVSLQRDKIKNALDVMIRSDDISANYRRAKQIAEADLALFPITRNIHWADFSAINEIIDMGYECARENVENIRAVYRQTNPFRKIFSGLRKKIAPDKARAVFGA